MFEIVLLNEKGEKFKKTFESYYFYNIFLNKAKRSKKLKIISFRRIV